MLPGDASPMEQAAQPFGGDGGKQPMFEQIILQFGYGPVRERQPHIRGALLSNPYQILDLLTCDLRWPSSWIGRPLKMSKTGSIEVGQAAVGRLFRASDPSGRCQRAQAATHQADQLISMGYPYRQLSVAQPRHQFLLFAPAKTP
jgi:hypothetical protein